MLRGWIARITSNGFFLHFFKLPLENILSTYIGLPFWQTVFDWKGFCASNFSFSWISVSDSPKALGCSEFGKCTCKNSILWCSAQCYNNRSVFHVLVLDPFCIYGYWIIHHYKIMLKNMWTTLTFEIGLVEGAWNNRELSFHAQLVADQMTERQMKILEFDVCPKLSGFPILFSSLSWRPIQWSSKHLEHKFK